MHTVAGGHTDEAPLRAVERPLRHEVAAVLIRVGVADHHFLNIPESRHSASVGGEGEQAIDDLGARPQVVDRLEQGGDVERVETRVIGENRDFEDIAHRLGLRDDQLTEHLAPMAFLSAGRCIEHRQLREHRGLGSVPECRSALHEIDEDCDSVSLGRGSIVEP